MPQFRTDLLNEQLAIRDAFARKNKRSALQLDFTMEDSLSQRDLVELPESGEPITSDDCLKAIDKCFHSTWSHDGLYNSVFTVGKKKLVQPSSTKTTARKIKYWFPQVLAMREKSKKLFKSNEHSLYISINGVHFGIKELAKMV
ncbi:hypothetical protein SELMODRAFT_448897 [Selaginella moellendorffii]|uniref:Uncharacterized protein n=1 Tax=Selaginella moellendorffii TaxID=88036 RepID=D8TB20_SELML|nr:hypothetical protein SELMODRAFT_448897 [Selaginella moellendorffii]